MWFTISNSSDHNPESYNPYFTLNQHTLSTPSNLQTPIQIPHSGLLALALKAASDEWNDPEVQLCNPILHSHSEPEGFWKFKVYLDKQFELNVITNKKNIEKSLKGSKYAYFELLNATIFCWAIRQVFSLFFHSKKGFIS